MKEKIGIYSILIKNNRIKSSERTEEELQELVNSIKKLGLHRPIVVREKNELVTGFWRLEAFKRLNEIEPDNPLYKRIEIFRVSTKEEISDLLRQLKDIKDSHAKDILFRLSCIYNGDLSKLTGFSKNRINGILKSPEKKQKFSAEDWL